jgi:hypothetical protein
VATEIEIEPAGTESETGLVADESEADEDESADDAEAEDVAAQPAGDTVLDPD